MAKFAAAFSLASSWTACRTADLAPADATSNVLDTTTESTLCGANESYAPFTLAALDNPPSPGIVQYRDSEGDLARVGGPEEFQNIRFDVCLGETNGTEYATLKKALVFFQQTTSNEVEIPVQDVQGLHPALFGSYEALSVKTEYRIPGNPRLWQLEVKGWTDPNGSSFVSVVRLTKATPQEEYRFNGFPVLVGKIVPGDPFPAGDCAFGQRLSTTHLAAGPYSVETKLCLWPGTGETMDYKVLAVTVRSEGAELVNYGPDKIVNYNEQARGERPCDPTQDGVCVSVKHHNWCDQMRIKWGAHVLGFSTTSTEVCTQLYPDVPPGWGNFAGLAMRHTQDGVTVFEQEHTTCGQVNSCEPLE